MGNMKMHVSLTATALISAFMVFLLIAAATLDMYGWLASTPWWLAFGLTFAAFIAFVRRFDARTRQAREAAQFAARADYEHWHVCRGDIRVGLYGAFQPPRI